MGTCLSLTTTQSWPILGRCMQTTQHYTIEPTTPLERAPISLPMNPPPFPPMLVPGADQNQIHCGPWTQKEFSEHCFSLFTLAFLPFRLAYWQSIIQLEKKSFFLDFRLEWVSKGLIQNSSREWDESQQHGDLLSTQNPPPILFHFDRFIFFFFFFFFFFFLQKLYPVSHGPPMKFAPPPRNLIFHILASFKNIYNRFKFAPWWNASLLPDGSRMEVLTHRRLQKFRIFFMLFISPTPAFQDIPIPLTPAVAHVRPGSWLSSPLPPLTPPISDLTSEHRLLLCKKVIQTHHYLS